jgi:hypothetical protein
MLAEGVVLGVDRIIPILSHIPDPPDLTVPLVMQTLGALETQVEQVILAVAVHRVTLEMLPLVVNQATLVILVILEVPVMRVIPVVLVILATLVIRVELELRVTVVLLHLLLVKFFQGEPEVELVAVM